jgi:diphthine-ammonia ligase
MPARRGKGGAQRAACLFSGGKDSVFAAHWAHLQGFDTSLLTIGCREWSMMFHRPNIEWTHLQAECMGMPHEVVWAPGEAEAEIAALEGALVRMGAQAIASGAIESEYQRQRLEAISDNLNIPIYAPLWKKGAALLEEMQERMEIYVVSVSAEGLGPELLGAPFRALSGRISAKKAPGVHPFLEGGEGETFVCDAPLFKKRIVIDEWKKEWDGVRGIAGIVRAHAVEK